MADEGFKRKLAAILSADVEGYSRLMGNDEASTILTLTAYKEAMTALIKQHRGRVVDAPGDNLLADFVSVVDAVQCAVEIQRDLTDRNEGLHEDRKMVFRIGVNLGDVVEEKNRIYGDGVNISARLESICEGGGVCISGTAFEHVENKLSLGFDDLGDHEVKNITKPVRVYRVKLEVPKPSLKAGMSDNLPLPDKPSIAVLPFTNMSGDQEQEYFSDGITEDIITELSRFRNLFVVARHSSFGYRDQSPNIKQIGRELGVHYVLEGSVRRAGNRIRITGQLVDAEADHHIWADRYDRELDDIFAVQDELTRSIVAAMAVRIENTSLELAERKPPNNMAAYDFWLRGKRAFDRQTHEGMDEALVWFEKAIEADPYYARGYAGLAFTHNMRTAYCDWGTPIDKAHERAVKLAEKAVQLDATDHFNHYVLGWCYLFRRRFGEAERHYGASFALNPHDADALPYRAAYLMYVGKRQEASETMQMALRLNPHHPTWYLDWCVWANVGARRYKEAIRFGQQLRVDSALEMPGFLAVAYAHAGQLEEARKLAQRFVDNVCAIWTGDTKPTHAEIVLRLLSDNPFRYEEDIEHFKEGLRIAGLNI
jgi:TolB-like protein/Tfp pilus assembly protein PilF